MTIGVVIPTYNSSQVVTDAIDSVLGQEPPPNQVVVVDDGSTDETPSILKEYQDRVEYVWQPNRGPSAARNCGWARLQTETVVFLDADDLLLPGGLVARRALLADGNATWGYTEGFLQDSAGSRRPFSKRYPPKEDQGAGRIFPDLLCRNFITASAIIVRRDALQGAGGFDGHIRGTEDWDLALRLAVHHAVRYASEPTFVQRLSADSLSRNRSSMDRMRCLTLVKTHRLYPKEVAAAGPSARRSVADAHNGIGYALGRQGRWREARPYLWDSVRLWPRQRLAWLWLIRSLLARPG